jgi:5-hydroxyisourate hydrolase-like protein (transthyretin family)
MKNLFNVGLIVLGLTVVSALSLTVHSPSQQPISTGFGAIEGHIVDTKGQAVAGATVFAYNSEGPITGRLSEVSTDKLGRFLLQRVKPGITHVHAFKENEGYPNTIFAVFAIGRVIPTVRVVEGQTTKEVIVQLGPKAGRLAGKVVDADSGRPLKEFGITIFNNDNPNDPYRSFGISRMVTQTAGGFEVLVPPVPFKVVVSAPNYEDQDATHSMQPQVGVIQKQPGTMSVESGQTEELTVLLRRKRQNVTRP